MPTAETAEADYVVVGTGSAGAVLAARLSEDPRTQVTVLEAGGVDRNRFVHIPAAFSKLFRSELDWSYDTVPQPGLAGRTIFTPRGRMLGGSSSINAMMWVRGFAADYDEWAEHAGPAWGYESMLRLLRRVESVEGAADDPDDDQGTDGPLSVSAQRSPRDFTGRYLDAVEESGFKLERANLPQPEGFSRTMVTQRKGARWSTADGYLRPAMKRPNLRVLTEALVTQVIFEGTTAVGVRYERDGEVRTVRARREVVLCGGAINTPQLLMLSGVGPGAVLREHGVPLVADAAEVGQNLLDHLVALIVHRTDGGTLKDAERLPEVASYLLRRRGMLTSNVAEAYGFVRSRPDLHLPDLELLFGPAPFVGEGLVEATEHGVALGVVLLKPESTGEVRLASSDPHTKPVIDPRYLSDAGGIDREALLSGLRTCQTIAHAPALAPHLSGYLQPPLPASASDDEVVTTALEQHAHTLYHPVGTCRMGRDEASVVSPELRVRGVQRLRVADASVMPSIIRGHTHAPSVLIGENAAELIRG